MRRAFVKIGLVIVVLVVVVAGVGGGLFYFFTVKFNPAPPSVDYPKPTSALEAQRQDTDYFGKLIALDRAFRAGGARRSEPPYRRARKADGAARPSAFPHRADADRRVGRQWALEGRLRPGRHAEGTSSACRDLL